MQISFPWVLFISVLVQSCLPTKSQSAPEDTYSPTLKTQSAPLVSPEDLRCILRQTLGRISYQRHKANINHIVKHFTPHLNRSLIKYDIGFKNKEIEIFLSQLIHESVSFLYSSETGSFRYYTEEEKEQRKDFFNGVGGEENMCSLHRSFSEGGKRYFDQDRRRFACFFTDKYEEIAEERAKRYEGKIQVATNEEKGYVLETTMRHNSYPSRWRGRGFIQLTHCINYLSYAEFKAHLNHCERKKLNNDCIRYAMGQSVEEFTVNSGGKEKKISFASGHLQCTEEELASAIKIFKHRHGLDLDQEKTLTDPYQVANICKPKHLFESAAWFWKKGYESCSKRATQTPKGNEKYCRQCDPKKYQWNAKWVKDEKGHIIFDENGEPAEGKCVWTRQCRQSKLKNVTSQEAIKISGATACINGSYCSGLEERGYLYTILRDYFQLSKDKRKTYCEKILKGLWP